MRITILLKKLKNIIKPNLKIFQKRKKKYINLYENNIKEIFKCMNLKEQDLKEFTYNKIKTIKDYLKTFCDTIEKKYYTFFITKNIDFFWTEDDFKVIIKNISLKYFYYEQIEKSKLNKNLICSLESNDNTIKDNKNYYKINFSIQIVKNSVLELISDLEIENDYESYLEFGEKGSGKGNIFEEVVKNKIKKGKIQLIKNLKIDESIELWSLESLPSKNSNVFGLFGNEFDSNKTYFVDLRKQQEKMFDCCFFDLKNNKIILIQITLGKNIYHDSFNREKLFKQSNKILNFLNKNYFKNNNFKNVQFLFVFLKFPIKNTNEFQTEYINKIKKKKKKINLKIMIDKCLKENLIYYIYDYSNPNNRTNILDNEKNLFIIKDGEKQNDFNQFKFNIIQKEKVNYETLFKSTINLKEINNNNIDGNIRKLRDYYLKKFNLENKKVYIEENKLIPYNSLSNYFLDFNDCFVIKKNNNLEKEKLIAIMFYKSKKVVLKIDEEKIKELKDENENLEGDYIIYYVGNKDEVKEIIYLIEHKILLNETRKIKKIKYRILSFCAPPPPAKQAKFFRWGGHK